MEKRTPNISSHYLNNVISNLEINGTIIDNLVEISTAQFQFYQNLYSAKLNESDPSYKESLDIFLKNNEITKLCQLQKTFVIHP